MAASTFAFAVEAPPSPIAFEPSKVYDSPIPGGGSMYFFRRVDVRAEGAASSETKLLALGSGSFATTMDCVRVLAGARTPVAIKQIAMDKRAAEAAEKEEVRGLKALSGRAHPNIVRYMAMFRGDDGGGRVRISFVFERCPLAVPFAMGTETSAAGVIIPTENVSQPPRAGCDLANNPICRAPCTLREAVCVVRQVLHALAYLHSCAPPIVHRDIKPENILIWGSDKCPATGENLLTVKVTDYGTLRTAPGGSSAEDLTLGRGTQAFMAPEVEEQVQVPAAGRGQGAGGRAMAAYNTSVDVFSAGATLFYLVTGMSPSRNTRLPWQERMGEKEVVDWEMSRAWYKKHAPEVWAKGKAAMAASQQPGGAPVPASERVKQVSVLNYHFPPGTPGRAFLEGLLSSAPRAAAEAAGGGGSGSGSGVGVGVGGSGAGAGAGSEGAAPAPAPAAPPRARFTASEAVQWIKENWADMEASLPPLTQV